MSNESLVEQRLEALERAVYDLQHQVTAKSAAGNWLEQITGSISDEAAFLEALQAGRAFRESDRPSDQPGNQR